MRSPRATLLAGSSLVTLLLATPFAAGGCSKSDPNSTKDPVVKVAANPDAGAPPARVVVEACREEAPPKANGWGFGMSGTGPGSDGGRGVGRIGKGGYGKLGHGRGTGTSAGYGGPRHPPTNRPQVRPGLPTVTGDLDKEIIRRYLRRNQPKFEYCYAKRLLVDPTVAGTVMLDFTIDAQGKVATAKGAGLAEVDACVAEVVKTIEFPKPTSGGKVTVRYPLTFSPSGGSGSFAEAPPRQPPPPKAPEAPDVYATTTLAEALRAGIAPLSACYQAALARDPKLAGTVQVHLTISHLGVPRNVGAQGVGDAAVEQCLAAALAKLTLPTPARRFDIACRLTLGSPAPHRPTVPAGTPSLLITPEAVSLDGKQLITVADLLKNDEAAIAPFRTAVHSGTLEQAQLSGQLLVRAHPDTPVDVVDLVLLYADADVLTFAVERPGGGYDVVAGFHAAGGAGLGPMVQEPPRPVLDPPRAAVLITPNGLWVGKTTGEKEKLTDIAALSASLAGIKLEFGERTDLEVGAETGVTWATMAAVLAVANAQGFSDVRIVDAFQMSVGFVGQTK